MRLQDFTEQRFFASEAISKRANEEFNEVGQPELTLKFGAQTAYLFGEFIERLTGKAGLGQEWQPGGIQAQLCKVKAIPCSEEYGAGTAIKAESEGSTKFVYGGFEATCTTAKFSGASNLSAVITGSFTTALFENCGAPGCVVLSLNTPYSFRILPSAPYSNAGGTMKVNTIRVELKCNAKLCVYDIPMDQTVDPFSIAGGAPAKFTRSPLFMSVVAALSEAGCPATGKWQGTTGPSFPLDFKFTAPATALWVRVHEMGTVSPACVILWQRSC